MRSLLIASCVFGFLGAQMANAGEAASKAQPDTAMQTTKTVETKEGQKAAIDAKVAVPKPADAKSKPVDAKAAGGSKAEAKKGSPIVVIKTSEGVMKFELAEKEAPLTVKNFLSYVNDKFYDGTVFHRVIEGFMIQGGGFASAGDKLNEKSTRSPIVSEAKNGLKNDRGTIAMARTADPNSATAQFFINHVNNNNLDSPSFDGYGYTVFGKIVDGIDVVDKIAKVKTGMKSGMPNVPLADVKIISIKVMGP